MGYGCDSVYLSCAPTLRFQIVGSNGFHDSDPGWKTPKPNEVNTQNASQRRPWVREMGDDEKRIAHVRPRDRSKDYVTEQPTCAPFYEKKETLPREGYLTFPIWDVEMFNRCNKAKSLLLYD